VYYYASLKIYTIFAKNFRMSKVKYIRVSTNEQNTGRQEVNSSEFSKLYIDKMSGAIPFEDRKEGKKLMLDIELGLIQEVHISSIDRLGRDILGILKMFDFFTSKSVRVYVENIGMYSMVDNKPNPSFKMIASVLGNVAEMERQNMLERQRQGIELAKAKGIYKGRLLGTKMTDEEVLSKYKNVAKELKAGESLRRAAKLGGCSLGTAQRIQRILNQMDFSEN
jgi:DNA invertase Pin-like site-specific DNA recombinase